MSKQPAKQKAKDVKQFIRKAAEKVSTWPEWKRGGSAAAAKTASSKKPPAGSTDG